MTEEEGEVFDALNVIGSGALEASVDVAAVVNSEGRGTIDTLSCHEGGAETLVKAVTLGERHLGTCKNVAEFGEGVDTVGIVSF